MRCSQLVLVFGLLVRPGCAKTISVREPVALSVTGSGSRALLNEDGYQQVASLKSDEEMKAFIRRVLESDGHTTLDEGELSGFAQHFSGTLAVQNFDTLATQLKHAKWAGALQTEDSEQSAQPAEHHQSGVRSQTWMSASRHQSRPKMVPRGKAKAESEPKKAKAPVTQLLVTAKNSEEPPQQQEEKQQEGKQEEKQQQEQKQQEQKQEEKQQEAKKPMEEKKEDSAPKPAEPSASKSNAPAGPARLPEVKSVLTNAANTMSEFTMQAKSMKEKVEMEQRVTKEALTKTKAMYQEKLSQLKTKTAQLNRTIEAVRVNISTLQNDNTALEKDANLLTEANTDMISAVKSMRIKTVTALEFLGDSVNVTDDSKREELQVLVSTTPVPNLDFFLSQARRELGLATKDSKDGSNDAQDSKADLAEGGMSLLQFPDEEETHEANSPTSLVSLLSESLATLAKSKEKAQNQLKEKFTVIMGAAESRYAQLEATHDTLLDEQTALEARKAALMRAKEHLFTVGETLITRLNGFSLFAKKVNTALQSAKAAAEE